MNFPQLAYIAWAKAQPRVAVNLARSGIDHCPPSLLGLRKADIVTNLPVTYGYAPLKAAIARRYGVSAERVFTVSGGTSFANYVACAAALDGSRAADEVLVERPTYEPLVAIPRAFGLRVRRFERTFADRFEIDLESFASRIGPRTRLAIVTNLHNPSGARIAQKTLKEMAKRLARVGAFLLVDEVYLECVFRGHPESSVHAGANVLITNSLTKAYGLDGLRAGWILGSRDLIARAGRINDLMTNNGVAPGERAALAAFRRHRALDRRSHEILDRNLDVVRWYFARERRFGVFVPEGGNVVFPRLPRGVDADRFVSHLVSRYSTLVVPGRFFEAPRHVRISFGCEASRLRRGLANMSRALDDLL
jgi:aspartate/methionine/tyrosine aminotransferase